MKVTHLTCILFISIIVLASGPAVGGEVDDAFYTSVASYFSVTADEVAAVRETGIATDEIPVALQVSRLTKVDAARVAAMRARGDSWYGIASTRNIGADAFYMMIGAPFSSKVYSPLLGKYKMTNPSQWKQIALTDDDIINLVNLRFISSQFDYSMFEVMKMRDNGDSFAVIATQVDMAKAELLKEQKKKPKVMQASSFGQ